MPTGPETAPLPQFPNEKGRLDVYRLLDTAEQIATERHAYITMALDIYDSRTFSNFTEMEKKKMRGYFEEARKKLAAYYEAAQALGSIEGPRVAILLLAALDQIYFGHPDFSFKRLDEIERKISK